MTDADRMMNLRAECLSRYREDRMKYGPPEAKRRFKQRSMTPATAESAVVSSE